MSFGTSTEPLRDDELAVLNGLERDVYVGKEEQLLATIAARDAAIVRLRSEVSRQEGLIERMAVGHTNAVARAESAELQRDARVAQLEAALRQTALDIGNAAALMMLANMPEECAVMRKCEEAARAALETR